MNILRLTQLNKYTLFGVGFGAGFPVLSVAFDGLLLRGGNAGIIDIVQANPVHGVAALTPLALGAALHLVGRARARIEEQSAAAAIAAASLNQIANRDGLTGFGNRHNLMCELRRLIATGVSNTATIRLFQIEIDDFNFINDTLGHQAGDELLRQASLRLSALMGPGQELFRHGGDDFAVLDRGDDNSGRPKEFAESLFGAFRDSFDIDGKKISVSAKAGVAQVDPADESESAVLSRADLALARARHGAANSFVFFSGEFADEARHRMAMEQELQRALDMDEFFLDFQPIVGIDNGKVRGFEALIRWNHPQRGIVPPVEFIPIAEHSGLILKIGAYVLNKACAEAVLWPTPVSVSVNVSAAQFKDTGFHGEVAGALTRSGLPATRLILEITESLLIENMDLVQHTFDRLREIGVRFALDDFGTGYSSINHLRSLKLDSLKLDKSFADRILTDKRELDVVRSIIDLSRAFDLNTTIEGVECIQQLEMMRRQGITDAQGFYFAKPMSNPEVHKLLVQELAGNAIRKAG